jgi:CspA family cold shock protein
VPQGKVKWFSSEKAFGFIEQDNDNDIFVHVTGLADGVTAIDKDMLVEYEVEQGRKGPQAVNVKPVTAAPPAVEVEEQVIVDDEGDVEVIEFAGDEEGNAVMVDAIADAEGNVDVIEVVEDAQGNVEITEIMEDAEGNVEITEIDAEADAD